MLRELIKLFNFMLITIVFFQLTFIAVISIGIITLKIIK